LIDVSSRPGKGSEFSVYLPLAGEEETARRESAPPDVRTGTETILIAEDDDDVRRLNRELLEECGYRVLEAASGVDALDIFLENMDAIDLLLLDVIMPRMNGREVYDQIRKIRPGAKALFTSGYTGDILGGAAGIDQEFDFLAKPLSPDVLLAKVREILDRT